MTASGAPPASEATVEPAPEHDDSYKWKAFTAIGIAFVTQVMSMSMVFVALSSIADDFGVSLRVVTWVVVAQALTISALMMPMGRLADIVGWSGSTLVGCCSTRRVERYSRRRAPRSGPRATREDRTGRPQRIVMRALPMVGS